MALVQSRHWPSQDAQSNVSTTYQTCIDPSTHTHSTLVALPTQEPLLQWHTPRDLLPTLHSQQASTVPQHPAFILRAHLPTFFQAAVFSPPPLQQFTVQIRQPTERMRPKRKAWEDTLILLRPWGQISNETHQRRTCRRDRMWLLSDPPQAKSVLASPCRATGLGPEAGCLPSRLSLPLAGLLLSPPSEQPSLPSPSKLWLSHPQLLEA